MRLLFSLISGRRFRALSLVAPALLCGAFLFAGRAEAAHFDDAVRGRIVIDVERGGEAWYVHPDTVEREFLGRPENAFRIMRERGLGVRNADLARIAPAVSEVSGGDSDADGLADPLERALGTDLFAPDSDGDGTSDGDEVRIGRDPLGDGLLAQDSALADRLKGRILLQVEGLGEAWYVHPSDGRRHYLGRPSDAFQVMRATGLGITHENLLHVPVAAESTSTVLHDVPFTAQAPLNDWSDPRQQDGCEEASAFMAMHWVEGTSFDLVRAELEIIAISDYERDRWGYYEDTSISDTAERIIRGWFGYDGLEVRYDIGVSDIYKALADGNVVIVAVNGRILQNPNFRAPGPIRHMILVTGYDAATGEFVVNEPGTSKGRNWRYHRQILADALMDYESGVFLPLPAVRRTAMIVVKPRAE